jgi:hypothetical protein
MDFLYGLVVLLLQELLCSACIFNSHMFIHVSKSFAAGRWSLVGAFPKGQACNELKARGCHIRTGLVKLRIRFIFMNLSFPSRQLLKEPG